MSWVAAGIASGAATQAGVMYVKKRRDAKRDAKNRPKYEIPKEIGENLSDAQKDALQGLPEEQRQMYLSNLQRGSAQALAGGGSRKAGLAGVQSINQQQNDAYGNLLSMDAQARMSNKQALYGARQTMADYRDQAFQFNTINPYYEQIAARNQRDEQLSQSLSSAAQMGGSGFMGGGAVGGKQQTAGVPQNTGGQKNPYNQKNIGQYNNPQTQNMFKQNMDQSNPYANNAGMWNDPNNNMFNRPKQNPYY